MRIVYGYAIHHPYRTLALTLLMAAAMAPGLARLKIRTDGNALVPANAPQVKLDAAIRAEFGLRDTIAVVVRSPSANGIFNTATLAIVNELTRKFSAISALGPADVLSLATEKSHRVKPGTLQFLRFLETVPTTTEQCQTLRADLHLIGLYQGILLSPDEKSTAIFINVPEGTDRIAFSHQIRRIIDQTPHVPDVISLTGAPVAESLLGTHILEDLGIRPAWLGSAGSDESVSGGFPRTLDELRSWLGHVVGILPIALTVMAIVFFVSFRSLAAAELTLFKVGMCLLILFALMGWCDVPIYLTIAVMPVILTATGVSDEVHIFDGYARLLRDRPEESHTSNLLRAMDEMWRPVVLTSVTTAIGFLSFAFSPLAPVRAFGVFTAIGSMLCMTWALTATPALVMLIHPDRFRKRRAGPRQEFSSPRGSQLFARLGEWIIGHRGAVLTVFAILLGLSVVGIQRVHVQDSWIDGFSTSSQFHQATTAFNDQFLGMHVLFVQVDTHSKTLSCELESSDVDHFGVKLPMSLAPDPDVLVGQTMELRLASSPADTPVHPTAMVHRAIVESAIREGNRIIVSFTKTKGSPRFILGLDSTKRVHFRIASEPFMQPEFLKKIKALEEFIAGRRAETVGGTLGPAKYLETTHFMGMGCREEYRLIPERDQLETVWRWYGTIRGPDRLRATVDSEFSRGVISVYMKNANFVDTARLLDLIREYERKQLTPLGVSLSFAGDVAVSQALIGAITSTQISSIGFSILGVFLSASVVHRSLKWGTLCALPAALAVLIAFGVMGFVGIPLGVATSMFAAMAVGIGDDYAIHLIERFRLVGGHLKSTNDAIRETLVAAGPANMVDAVSVALGFGVLMLSQVPANARLGAMVLVSILTCLAGTTILLPAVLSIFRVRTNRSDGLNTANLEVSELL